MTELATHPNAPVIALEASPSSRMRICTPGWDTRAPQHQPSQHWDDVSWNWWVQKLIWCPFFPSPKSRFSLSLAVPHTSCSTHPQQAAVLAAPSQVSCLLSPAARCGHRQGTAGWQQCLPAHRTPSVLPAELLSLLCLPVFPVLLPAPSCSISVALHLCARVTHPCDVIDPSVAAQPAQVTIQ